MSQQRQQQKLFDSDSPASRLDVLRSEFAERRGHAERRGPIDIWVPVPASSGTVVAKVSVSIYGTPSSFDDDHLSVCTGVLWRAIERIGNERAKRSASHE